MFGEEMQVLVTGGAGFIGSNYVRRILDGTLSHVSKVRVLDKLTYAGNLRNFSETELRNIEFIEGDICDMDLLERAAEGCDAIVNFAAESHVDRSITDSRSFVTTNILGVQILLDAAKRIDCRYVQVSTDEVYGSIETGSWNEDQPLQPNSPYAATKAAGDLLTRSFFKTYQQDVLITRSSNNYGPHQYPEKIIPLFVKNLIEGKRIPLYGLGLNIRDWLHVDDNCAAIHAVLTKGQSGEIYNIGGGTELSNLEISKKILEIMGGLDSSIEFVEDRPGHDARYSVDDSKIRKEFDWAPKVAFHDGLVETIRWYQSNPTFFS